MDGKVCTAAEAMADIHDGDHVAAHSWGVSGTPGYLFRALVERGVKNLTFYCNNFLPSPPGLKDLGLPDSSVTILLPQLKKIVAAFIGARAFRGIGEEDFLGERLRSGQLEIEISTHGVYMERFHAGAARLGGFYSPVGLNTIIEKGKEKRVIDGREYIFQKPIRPDVALIKAVKADKLGNLIYHGTSRGSNPIIAMAAKLTIVEVDEVVEVGELDPEIIVTPGIFVDRIVRVPDDDTGSAKRKKEILEIVLGDETIRELMFGAREGGQE